LKKELKLLVKNPKPCMLCGKGTFAKYPYYRLVRQENAWSYPKTVGRICEDCMDKIGKKNNS